MIFIVTNIRTFIYFCLYLYIVCIVKYSIAFFPTVASSGIKMTTGAGMSRKTGTPNPLTMAGKLEHALVAQTIKEIIGPRFTDQVSPHSLGVKKKRCYTSPFLSRFYIITGGGGGGWGWSQ